MYLKIQIVNGYRQLSQNALNICAGNCHIFASFCTSPANTANPLPCSPALVASMSAVTNS